MTIQNKEYIIIMSEPIRQLALTQPRLARILRANSIIKRLYVQSADTSQYFVVDQYQSGNFGKVIPA
jgi:hypothetical protein